MGANVYSPGEFSETDTDLKKKLDILGGSCGQGQCSLVTHRPLQFTALGLLPAASVGTVTPSESRLLACY